MKKKILFPLLFLFIIVFSFIPLSLEAGDDGSFTETFSAFENNDLSTEELRNIARFVFLSLNNESSGFIFPESLINDDLHRYVILSISDGTDRYSDHYAWGKGITVVLEEVLSKVSGTRRGNSEYVAVHLAGDFERIENSESINYLSLDAGIEGIFTEEQLFLPERLLFSGLLDSRGRLFPKDLPLEKKSFLSRISGFFGTEENTDIYRFTTRSFFTDGEKILTLYRGHGVFDDLDEALLLERIDLASDYLERAVGDTGKFRYSYQADRNSYNSGYNILRHCGTLYSMLEVYEITKEEMILEKAEMSIGYLMDQIREGVLKNEKIALVEEGGAVKLGGNGLAIVALAKYTEVTGNRKYLPVMQRMARWMELTQNDEGNFSIHKMAYPSGAVSSFISSFYPGEAILSLVRLHSLDGDPVWLDVAERASKYLINVRDRRKTVRNIPHDHWLLYGLNDLYGYRKDPLYLEHAFKIADAMILRQNRNSSFPDWVGGYYSPPGSTPTATRSEGLCAASRLALASGNKGKAEKYIEAIEKGVAFQLNTQIGPENAWWFPDPHSSQGGFRKDLTDSEIRIDYVQHNISAMAGLLGLMSDKGATDHEK